MRPEALKPIELMEAQMSLAKYQWWIVAQGMLLGGIALNMLTLQQYRLGMGLALACLALTFASHDLKGRARR